MADFKTALKRTLLFEGTWSDTQGDKGKETCFGISRHWHPPEKKEIYKTFWDRVDTIKKKGLPKKEFLETLEDDFNLITAREDIYQEEYWEPIHGDDIHMQRFANHLFDCAVHNGTTFAIKSLQKSLNFVLNNNFKLQVDGKYGNQTKLAFEHMQRYNDDILVLDHFLILRKQLFDKLASESELHRGNYKGYCRRLKD